MIDVASGGARGNAGRPFDPNALHSKGRNADVWTVLEVPTEPAPEWPLRGCSDRELEVWGRLWRKPQASQWRRLGLDDEVALYVRYFVGAEDVEAKAALRTLVKQHQELLGLSTAGLNRLHWRMPEDAPKAATALARPARSSSKARLKVVGNGG